MNGWMNESLTTDSMSKLRSNMNSNFGGLEPAKLDNICSKSCKETATLASEPLDFQMTCGHFTARTNK